MRHLTRQLKRLSISALALTGLIACSQSLDGSSGGLSGSSGQGKMDTNAEGVERSFAGDGGLGGFYLISAMTPYGCLAYPISTRRLITPASCVEECARDSLCDIAVMRGEGYESLLIGLVDWVALAPMGQYEDQESLAVISLDRDRELSSWPISSHADGGLQLLDEPRELDEVDTLTGKLVSNETCPEQSLGLFNEQQELVGLSLAMSGSCDEFLFLDAFENFISQALEPTYLPPELEPEPEPEPEPEEDPFERYEEERQAALDRAPASCASEDEDYCDGDIEMRCRNGSFSALHCGQVGWTCEVSETWGASCEP